MNTKESRKNTLYLFLDEGGDFNFSSTGTKYFSISCVAMIRPFNLHTLLDTFKYDLLEYKGDTRIDLECFHCSHDNKHVKNRVFEMLSQHLSDKCVDSVLIEKRKTGPALRAPEKFYPKMLGYLLRHACAYRSNDFDEVIVITDTIPVARKRKAIEKACKTTLKDMLPSDLPFIVMHHASKAHYGLQIADYANWAIFRKWEHSDSTQFDKVSNIFRSEFDIFRSGTRFYY